MTLAAAARARALRQGAEPRLEIDSAGVADLALKEIAASVFPPQELAPFLPRASECHRCRLPDRAPNLAAADQLVPPPRPPPKKARQFIDEATRTGMRNPTMLKSLTSKNRTAFDMR
ncbi:DNA-directed RNA polymerase subunit omega (plasmid) [Pelagibacterium sp. H642]|nr:DNA-directed RNA polymerase subunit omega [Pelagibacterium sp. H642]